LQAQQGVATHEELPMTATTAPSYTPGTVEISGKRVEARADGEAITYLTSAGKWRAASTKAAATFEATPVAEFEWEPATTADGTPVPHCKKVAEHGPLRVTARGSRYCIHCDRIVAARQKAERAAAKEASSK